MTTDLEPIPTARELRGEIRDWRRGRAELRWTEALSDAYVAAFCAVMIAAMAGNVVLHLRRLADETCIATCSEVRTAAPWLVLITLALLALGLARLLGPVFSPPAANGWLLSAPVDRGRLLGPGWLRTAAFSAIAAAVLLLAPALLSGYAAADVATYVLAGTSVVLTCVGVAALGQIRETSIARWLTWSIALVLWAGLVLAATRRLHLLPGAPAAAAPVLTALALVAALLLIWRTTRSLGGVSRRVLGYTERLSPSLSGALSSVDLGLMYDVLLARRWGRGAYVRSHRGGPLGPQALVHRDLRRALRSPQPFVVLAALALVPYAVAQADAGRAVVLATTLAGLLGGPAMCSGLRVVVRTDSIARMLPFDRRTLLLAHLVVPGTALVLFGLSSTGTLTATHPPGEAVAVALACGLSSLAATVRWVTGKPPNYAAPLISSPAGGLPPGVLGSLVRGFDVWAFTALPLIFGTTGFWISVTISLSVIAYLTSDQASRTT